MKKIVNLILVSILLFTFTGCGENHEEEIKSNVNEYFTILKSGDYTGTTKLCSEDYNDGFGVKEYYDSLNKEMSDPSMGEAFIKEGTEFTKKMMAKAFKSNTIDSVEEEGDTATVVVSGECIDLNVFDNIEQAVDFNALGEEYGNAHLAELQDIYINQGEEAMQESILKGVTPLIFDKFEEYIDKSNYVQYKMEVKIKKVNDQWLISSIDGL